jgi:plasmid stabilization system protein ParE
MVTWVASALDELADIWNEAQDRQAVTEAANRIDRALGQTPDQKGRPRGKYRIFRDFPVTVLFRVVPEDCRVFVVQVRRIKE